MKNKLVFKSFALVSVFWMVFFVIVGSVKADGVETKRVCTQTSQYGGAVETTCWEEEVPKEEVVHDVTEVDTGIVENVLLAAGLMGIGLVIMWRLQGEEARFEI